MTKSIITVSREFGSGGRTIAHKVAERLGVPYYDKELIKAVAEKTGFDPKFIEERGEYAPGRTIFSMLPVFDGTQGALSARIFCGPCSARSSWIWPIKALRHPWALRGLHS